ncbi:MAG: SET domain-containing protein-lysine N-methyltransferase [Opitutaceae bacterium]|nr:SET domain-containing protein-lysine N-methyltransferase [Opitutaceae bacterium]
MAISKSVSKSPKLRARRAAASPWVVTADSAIHGRGVYARTFIPAGTKIIEYTGERITKAESARREILRARRQQRGGDGCVYIFELNRRYDVDGRNRGNPARLINHSCEPNCRSDIIRGRIWILAIDDIPPGTELTFDYGYTYAESLNHRCRCGAPSCAGYIVDANHRWRVRRRLALSEARRAAVGAATA